MKTSRKQKTSWLQVMTLVSVMAVGVIAYTGLALIDTAQSPPSAKP
ncbi:hypothetical protein [Asticcacaulis sp. 201]|nr:hypothetical protein [Asticcacaulis sp. 201]MDV6331792.1 hypothetical protein [Asticcacaulis sp. 201]